MPRLRLIRAVDRARGRLGLGRGQDPVDGSLLGALRLHEAVDAGRASAGRHTYGEPTLHFGPGDRARVDIGAFCSFAVGVRFVAGGNHRPDWISTYPFRARWGLPGAYEDGHPRPAGDITVGNDVWFGLDATVLAGATIGDGAVVGAGAVVSGEVRPYAIVVGNPAREVHRRFADDEVEALRALRWWDWPDEEIRRRVPELSSGDVAALVAGTGRTVRAR